MLKLPYSNEEFLAILERAGRVSNENLLYNWYFKDPVNQRQGYVAVPGANYYLDPAMTQLVGQLPAYFNLAEKTDTYGMFYNSSGVALYVALEDIALGGCNSGTTVVDGWTTSSTSAAVVEEDGLFITVTNGNVVLGQRAENPKALLGKTVTWSGLFDFGLATYTYTMPEEFPAEAHISVVGTVVNGMRMRFAIFSGGYITTDISSGVSTGASAKLYAVKLEISPFQTLARKDETGAWVLNDPPPSKALELIKCQRYYQLFSSAEKRPSALEDYRPAMYAQPRLGTVNVNGQTLYYADASL